MKRFLKYIALAVFAASAAYASSTHGLVLTGVALSSAAPSAAPTTATAVEFYKTSGFRVTVCAAAGATITGGTIRFWHFEERQGLWALNPALNQTLASSSTRCLTLPDLEVHVKNAGWLAVQTSSVTVSSGTTVSIAIESHEE